MTDTEARLAARELIHTVRVSTLITLDAQGQPVARSMETARVDDDLTVWFASRASSSRCEQIRNNPTCTVFWQKSVPELDTAGYAQLFGTAEVLTDSETRGALWREEWAQYFTDGVGSDDYAVIRIAPKKLCYSTLGMPEPIWVAL